MGEADIREYFGRIMHDMCAAQGHLNDAVAVFSEVKELIEKDQRTDQDRVMAEDNAEQNGNTDAEQNGNTDNEFKDFLVKFFKEVFVEAQWQDGSSITDDQFDCIAQELITRMDEGAS